MTKLDNYNYNCPSQVCPYIDMSKYPYVHMSMDIDIWTYGYLGIQIKEHVAVMQDVTIYIVLKIQTGNVQKKTQGICRSFKTFIHFRRFVTLDALSLYFCLSLRFVHLRFVTIYLMSFQRSVYVLSQYTFCRYSLCLLYVLSFRRFVIIGFLPGSFQQGHMSASW